MRTSFTTLALIAAASAAATGCSSLGRSMGMERSAPDEFRVVTRAPLTLPPEYSLRPPRPGEARPQEQSATEEARTALFGQDVGQTASAGERSLVNNAGAQTVDPTIRDTVDFESGNVVHRREAAANAAAGLDNRTPEQRARDEEQARRVTGGGGVTIERREGEARLPGT